MTFANLFPGDALPMARRITALATLTLAGVLCACVVHEPKPAFRAGVYLGDRGISVPLPPPSLVDEPQQDVEVDGEVETDKPLAAGSTVHVVDLHSGERVEVELAAGSSEFTASLHLDLTDHCLELWVQTPDGEVGDRMQYRAEIVDATTLDVNEGC